MSSDRLQKIMAACGIASRRSCEDLISAGKVRVNGKKAELGCRADIACDRIEVEGFGVLRSTEPEKVYIMLNKPRGFVTTVKDEGNRPTVMQFVKDIKERVFPVGRLDRDTEGLLLFTNDGDFAYALTHPSHLIDKTYIAEVDILPEQRAVEFLETGICLEDGWTAPAKVRILPENRVQLTIHEGRKHQVKRMLSAVGCRVLHLERVKLGCVSLGRLPRGKYRFLSNAEIKGLLK